MKILRAWMLGLTALGVWCLCYLTAQPPAAHHGTQPVYQFSAARAEKTLAGILGQERPHPVSSDENAAVRGRILKEFATLGIPARTYASFTCNAWRGGRFVACARVTDIIAEVVPGDGKAIILLAHYDSVPAGPGASDDESGVATVLETARAIRAARDRSHHPILAVLTDGEEAGLLGANAFLQNPQLKSRVGAVVNVEARGTRGPSLLFQTSAGDAPLIDLYAAHVSTAYATSSLYEEIYKFLPNDTDLTLFIRNGFPSFNFAFADNVRYYHSPKDTRANLSHATLQMQGDNMLGVVRGLEQADFTRFHHASNAVYMSVFGQWLPRIPESWALPLAIIVFVVLLLAAWLSHGQRRDWKSILGAAVMPLAMIVGCAVLGFGLALVAQAISGQPDPTYAYPIVMRIALGIGVWGMALLVSRLASPHGGAAAAWLWMSGLGVIMAAFLPGFSPYFLFPSVVAAVFLLATARIGWETPLGQGALLASALAALITWFPLVVSGETLMGLKLHELFTIPAALGLITLVPLVSTRPPARSVWLISAITSLVIAVGGAIIAGLLPTYSAASPQRINLYYAEAPNAPARWAAVTTWKGSAASPIPQSLIKAGGFTLQPDNFTGFDFGDIYVAKAGHPLYPLPVATIANNLGANGRRIVTLQLRGSPQTNTMTLGIPADARLSDIYIHNQHVRLKDNSGSTLLACLSRDCRNLKLTLVFGTVAPVILTYAEQRFGLPPSANFLKAARPNTAMSSQSGDEINLANRLTIK